MAARRMPARARVAVVSAVVGAALVAAPAHGGGERIGVYLDDAATTCNAPLMPFETQTVYICGFPPLDSLVGGAVLSLKRPAGIEILAVRLRKDIVFEATGDVEQVNRLDLSFYRCEQGTEPLVLMEVDIFDSDLTGPRPDVALHLKGAGVDSLNYDAPQWKICDPQDPLGHQDLLPAVAVDTVFNCTQACTCTTPVARKTWAAVKSLYQGR